MATTCCWARNTIFIVGTLCVGVSVIVLSTVVSYTAVFFVRSIVGTILTMSGMPCGFTKTIRFHSCSVSGQISKGFFPWDDGCNDYVKNLEPLLYVRRTPRNT